MVCNGRETVPIIPEIPGTHEFRGRRRHGHEYRTPEKSTGKKFVALGAGPSRFDITNDICLLVEKACSVLCYYLKF